MRVPNHIAIILDGNGRWAKKRGMPRSFGHVKGCENLEDICEVAKELGVKYLTVYAFSTENWKRSKEEVDGLMKLFRNYLKKCIKISQKNNMRVKVIGDITAFDSDIQESIEKLEDFSKDFTDLHFQIALNYGSRDEITRAVNRMLEDQKAGKLETPVSEDTISDYLDTAGLPDPDLMIRTSGELRLSNYLLWQLAYSEFYFTDVPWPDFKKEELVKAIEKYNERDRRYGGVKEE
ncbi:isoprenyl transferase [Blautia sp. SG-772]|jgi:undecaprenyl diphosphate synthase|nr:isoprenyl transferase [Blautia sp. AM16-16B]RHR18884.1 isoprenyl transferase [Blautia sp. AF19-34]RHS53549.1 isoprenyl transferase [Blautia sp. AM46-5]RHS57525.1 isoprenyl transferase [Blautia sp. AM46-3MH]RHU44286.1 isoprenyl transferase [Blautia sp. TF11-31AT]RST83722.1 isoprenyl transferase [Blautia sp. SG-772]CDB19650.1 isoprenyl transferase [Blautia sp. CAG:52]